MKKLLIVFIILMALAIAGCGGDSSSPSDPSHPPSISNLQFYPTSAKVNEGGGAITVVGEIDYIDTGRDIILISIVTEKWSETKDISITKTSGTLTLAAMIDTTVAGIYPFSVFVTDSQAQNSNALTGTFTVQ